MTKKIIYYKNIDLTQGVNPLTGARELLITISEDDGRENKFTVRPEDASALVYVLMTAVMA